VLAFRSDNFQTVLLFSLLSFLRMVLVFYSWLLALAIINRNVAEPDPLQKVLRLHLGPIGRWPWQLQLLLPPLVVVAIWLALQPLLVHLEVLAHARSATRLIEQGFVIGLCLFLTLKYLLPVFLLLHLFASYVYFGGNPLWEFIATTARNMLAPLQRLPCRLVKVDFAPVIGAALILFLLHVLPTILFRRLPLSLWPQ
jgi:uncharacterized protein YggT (Ycf19 family)